MADQIHFLWRLGTYPHETSMQKVETANKDFKHMLHRAGPQAGMLNVLSAGWVRSLVKTPTKAQVAAAKGDELTDECRRLGLPVSGTKRDKMIALGVRKKLLNLYASAADVAKRLEVYFFRKLHAQITLTFMADLYRDLATPAAGGATNPSEKLRKSSKRKSARKNATPAKKLALGATQGILPNVAAGAPPAPDVPTAVLARKQERASQSRNRTDRKVRGN